MKILLEFNAVTYKLGYYIKLEKKGFIIELY